MNYLDIIIGIILILFLVSGVKDGLFGGMFSLVAIVAGVYGAMFLSDVTADFFADRIGMKHEYLAIISFLLIFLIILILVRLLGQLLEKFFEKIKLGFVDKIGGAVFGVCKGFFLLSLLILVLNFFCLTDIIPKETRCKSLFYPTTERIANYLYENHGVARKAVKSSLKSFKNDSVDYAE